MPSTKNAAKEARVPRTKSGPRSMTFTGCWTCKRRKVKCDERPEKCANCERMGISCDGYNVELQWVTDPFSEPRPNRGPSRGRIRIARDSGIVYSLESISEFLSSLDEDDRTVFSSRRGPFSFFTCQPQHRNSVVPEPRCQVSDTRAHTAYSKSQHEDSQASTPKEPAIDVINEGLETGLVRVMPKTPAILTDKAIFEAATPGSRSSSAADTLISRSICTTSSMSNNTRKLMHHYVLHISGLLQPIEHPQNPYRALYVPAALVAASSANSGVLATRNQNELIHSVLLHSLMSSSAFHLWNCSSQPQMHMLGYQHRQAALGQLTAALQERPLSIDYETLMMAMLSLVSIDIMSGCEADFVIHLRGTKQLKKRRHIWKAGSDVARQLYQISDFFLLLTRTTWFPTSVSAWSTSAYVIEEEDDNDDDEATSGTHNDSCYPYMYGISPTLASYMKETCRLAERLAMDDLSGREHPETLRAACVSLGDRILSWTLETDNVRIATSNDQLAMDIFRPHTKAWHLAIAIYYFRRIHKRHSPGHEQNIRAIFDCMCAVEDIKERSRSPAVSQMAPITWPAFIASCEGELRQEWTEWWQRALCYRIANIRRQWEMVQTIWQQKDEMGQNDSGRDFDWIEVFKGHGRTVMPI